MKPFQRISVLETSSDVAQRSYAARREIRGASADAGARPADEEEVVQAVARRREGLEREAPMAPVVLEGRGEPFDVAVELHLRIQIDAAAGPEDAVSPEIRAEGPGLEEAKGRAHVGHPVCREEPAERGDAAFERRVVEEAERPALGPGAAVLRRRQVRQVGVELAGVEDDASELPAATRRRRLGTITAADGVQPGGQAPLGLARATVRVGRQAPPLARRRAVAQARDHQQQPHEASHRRSTMKTFSCRVVDPTEQGLPSLRCFRVSLRRTTP